MIAGAAAAAAAFGLARLRYRRWLASLIHPEIGIEARRESGAVVVHGAAALPDGTVLTCELGDDLAHSVLADAVVRDGRYDARFDGDWPEQLWAAVSLRGGRHQPPETRALIGERGQRLAADVVSTNGVSEAFVTRRFRLD